MKLITVATVILIILCILCTQVVSGNPETDHGAEMVEKGITQTIISLANDIYSMSVTDSADSTTVIMMAAYTMDPYQVDAVNDTNVIITDMFYCFYIIIIFVHGGVILLTRYAPEKLESFEFIDVDFNGYQYSEYVIKMMKGILILSLSHFCIKFILDLEQWITIQLLQNVPGSIEPSPDNAILYSMMSVIWLSLLLFFIIRGYVILLIAGFAIGIGVTYIWGPTEHIAIMLWKYFLTLTFMQPIIVGISCLVIRAVKEGSGALEMGWILDTSVEVVQYAALLVLLFCVAFVCVFAPVLEAMFRVVTRKAF